jgi:hypothetical protein
MNIAAKSLPEGVGEPVDMLKGFQDQMREKDRQFDKFVLWTIVVSITAAVIVFTVGLFYVS